MAAASELRLAAGPLSIDLAPGIGGSVGALRWRGRNVLRPLSEADRAAGDVLGVAAFPMLPVANRIAGNAFRFEGRAFAVAANNPPERFHVHGTGWRAAWTVAEASPTTARFDLVQTEPWPFRASQSFTLTADALDLRLTLENAGRERAPFGFGWHPWFPRDPDAQLRFRASHFYLEEPEGCRATRSACRRSSTLPVARRCRRAGGTTATAAGMAMRPLPCPRAASRWK